MTDQLTQPPATDTIGAALTQEHDEIDALLARFGDSLAAGTPDVAVLEKATRVLKHHIWVEEELHFPQLRDGDLMFQMVLLLREHGEIWLLLDSLAAEIAEERDPAKTFSTLLQMLECHNPKEEQLIYPAGDDLLDAATTAEVRDALRTQTIPADFRPQIPCE